MKLPVFAVIVVLFAVGVMGVPHSSTSRRSKPAPGCLDENGNPVPWWVMLKIPNESGGTTYENGYGYLYADSSSPSLELAAGSFLNSPTAGSETAVGNTVNQVAASDPSSTGFFMYNDQPPDDDDDHESYGHTKGVMFFDETQGFWLVHSTPHWPAKYPAPYSFPEREDTYGQSFLCISMGASDLNNAAGMFLLNKPYVYDSHMTTALNSSMPNIVKMLNHDFQTSTGEGSYFNLHSTGGNVMTQFGKNAKFNGSLYEDLVSPHFKNGFYWETWQNGANNLKMPTYCPPQYPYASMNVTQVQFSSDIAWSETQDHSKWGVAQDTSQGNLVCIGDMNRQYSQQPGRGGGTVCFKESSLYKSFFSLIKGAFRCQ